MYLLGTIFIVSGVVTAALASLSYALVIRGRIMALPYGRLGARVALGATLLVVALLIYLFVTQRYDVRYVYTYSSNELPIRYRIAAMWAGQPGSFAIWALWQASVAQLLIRRARHAEPYVLSAVLLIQAMLLLFTLILNPFAPYLTESGAALRPADGSGLNELLYNPWMIIHPPVLFGGYALLAIPFGFAVAGLWRRDYDGWAHAALPWALAGWTLLGVALLMGGYWAYETQGWGGYWGWAAVENSALVPWLTATALIHAMLLQRAHSGLRRTTFALAIGTYLLVFYGTYLTRSGVLANFSVHTFAQEAIQPAMTLALSLLVISAGVLFAWRWLDIPTRSLAEYVLSRDSFFALAILGLLLIGAVVEIGTSMPLISAMPGVGDTLQRAFSAVFDLDYGARFTNGLRPFSDGRFSLVASFYNATVPPLGIVLALLLTIGPLLGQRDTNPRRLLRALGWPAIAATTTVSAALLLGVRDSLPLAYLGLGSFAAGANMLMIVRMLKSGWLHIGGYLAHVGMAVLVAGIIGSTSYATPEQKIVVPEGEHIRVYGYDFTFNGWRATPEYTGVLDLTVTRGSERFQAAPLLYYIPRRSATLAKPAIKQELLRDLYIIPVSYQARVDPNSAELGPNETGKIGPYTVTFLGFETPGVLDNGRADVGAKIRVGYQGREVELTPRIRWGSDQRDPAKVIQAQPVTLLGGHSAALANFDSVRQKVTIGVDGLNLPIDPAKAVVTISLKPGIAFVWLGVGISMLGGLIALIRRTLEGQARRTGQRTHLPRGLVGLAKSVGFGMTTQQPAE